MGDIIIYNGNKEDTPVVDIQDLLKQVLDKQGEYSTTILQKLKQMADVLDDLSVKVDDLQKTVDDVQKQNADYIKTITDKSAELEAANAELQKELDDATKGGTVLDATKVAAISAKIDSIKADLQASVPGGTTTGGTSGTDTTGGGDNNGGNTQNPW